MDLYLPDDFHALRDECAAQTRHYDAAATQAMDARAWLGADAFVAPLLPNARRERPRARVADPSWNVV